MKDLAKVRAELTALHTPEATEAKPAEADSLYAGQTVLYRPWNKRAVIREVDASQSKIKLDLSGVSLWVELAQIADPATPAKSGEKADPLPHRSAGTARLGFSAMKSMEKTENSLLRLDLRGKRADLAEGELTHFLDASLLAGSESVEIVHGRGTGALRKQVHAVLRAFPGIASFTLASEDRGGDGMTIVTFR